MARVLTSRAALAVAALSLFMGLMSASAVADLDPKAISIQMPKDIKWVRNGGAESAVLVGDPAKSGLYVVLQKWLPHNNSRPHFHQNDRYIYVISGTWWVGTGDKFDPESTVPVPAGSYVVHYGKKIHFDGAKDEECVIQVWGMGPATATPAERK